MDVLEKKQQSYVTEKVELLEKMSMLDKQTIQLQTELDHLAKQLGSFSLFELQTMIGERTNKERFKTMNALENVWLTNNLFYLKEKTSGVSN